MKTLRWFWVLLHGEVFWLLLGLGLGCVTLAANIALLGLSGWFLAAMGLAGVAGVSMNYFTPAAMIRGLAILRTAGRYGEKLATHDATFRITARLRVALFRALDALPMASYLRLHSGDMLQRLRGDIETVEKFYLIALVPAAIALCTALGLMVALALFMPVLAVLLPGLLLLAGFGVPWLVARASRRAQAAIAEQTRLFNETLTETLQSAAECMVYGRAAQAARSASERGQAVFAAQSSQHWLALAGQGATSFIAAAAVPAVLVALMPLIAARTIEPAMIAAWPLLAMACFDAVAPLAAAWQGWRGANIAVERLTNFAPAPAMAAGQPERGRLQLSAENLGFAYRPDRPVLHGLSFSLSAGESLAITGPSGIGKSTLVHLLCGLWPATSGRVMLNGLDAAASDGKRWREYFSVAEQKPHIFAGTLRQNLLVADPAAADDRLMTMLGMVGLDAEVRAMPEGLNSFVGEHGLALSGGQIRRLAIARALLKPAPFLILDEPTDSLDESAGRSLVQAVLCHAEREGMAVIIITHNSAIADLCAQQLRLGANLDRFSIRRD